MQSMLAFGVRVCVNTFRVFVHRTSLFSNIVIVFESGNSAADMMVILRIRFHGCAAPFNMHNRKLIRPLLSAQSNAQFVSQRSLKSEKNYILTLYKRFSSRFKIIAALFSSKIFLENMFHTWKYFRSQKRFDSHKGTEVGKPFSVDSSDSFDIRHYIWERKKKNMFTLARNK